MDPGTQGRDAATPAEPDGVLHETSAVEGTYIETAIIETAVMETSVIEEFYVTRRPPIHHVITWHLLDRARAVLSILVVAIFLPAFILQPFRIPSESMERTLLVGDFLLVNKAIYAPAGSWKWLLPYHSPQHGDIVVFHFPLDPDEHVVKRVIGVGGDRIHLHDGIVYRDGDALTEPYTTQPNTLHLKLFRATTDDFRDDFPVARFTDPGVDGHWWLSIQRSMVNGEVVTPTDQYFVMGDNRNHSRDSRYWGFVPRQNIVGMPLFIYFSLREPSRTDPPPSPGGIPGAVDDRLGKSKGNALLDFARWDRILRVVR